MTLRVIRADVRQKIRNAGHIPAGKKPKGIWMKEPVTFEKFTNFRKKIFFPQLRKIAKQGTISVLDLGCGNGTKIIPLLIRLAEEGQQVTATLVDYQPDAIKSARAMAKKLEVPKNVNISYEVANVTAFSPSKDHFDCVLLDNLIHFLSGEETLKLLQRLHKGLKPDGLIFGDVCSIFNAANIGDEKHDNLANVLKHKADGKLKPYHKVSRWYGDMYFYTAEILAHLFGKADYKITNVQYYRNEAYPNSLGMGYPENIVFIARRN